MTAPTTAIRRIEPLAGDWRSASWGAGQFDTAGRGYTREVEGVIRTPQHVLMVTLSGAAEHLEVSAECGHRYNGPDFAGSVSFVPAGCTRHLSMRGVESVWGSVSLDTMLFGDASSLAPFSNVEDPYIAATLGMLADRIRDDDGIDALLGEAIGLALARYLQTRWFQTAGAATAIAHPLPRWKIRRIVDYVDAHLAEGLRIADLAALVGLSPGYFHRAFKVTMGCTPLAYVQRCRIERAAEMIRLTDCDLTTIAFRHGFQGPSHFAKTFRRAKGCSPSEYRRVFER